MLFAAVAISTIASAFSCAPKDACLRHSDCEDDQMCIEGRCFDPDAPGGNAGAGGAGGAGGN